MCETETHRLVVHVARVEVRYDNAFRFHFFGLPGSMEHAHTYVFAFKYTDPFHPAVDRYMAFTA